MFSPSFPFNKPHVLFRAEHFNKLMGKLILELTSHWCADIWFYILNTRNNSYTKEKNTKKANIADRKNIISFIKFISLFIT